MLQHSPIKSLPIIRIASEFYSGTNLVRVAQLLNLAYDPTPQLDARKLIHRLCEINSALTSYAVVVPRDMLSEKLPGRERTILGLVNHIAEISAVFIDVCGGASFTATKADAETEVELAVDEVIDRTQQLNDQLLDLTLNPRTTIETYYGEQSLHAVFNRTVCHSAQHLRQLDHFLRLQQVFVDSIELSSLLENLSLPNEVWD